MNDDKGMLERVQDAFEKYPVLETGRPSVFDRVILWHRVLVAVRFLGILLMCVGLVSATLNNNPIVATAIIASILAASSWEVGYDY